MEDFFLDHFIEVSDCNTFQAFSTNLATDYFPIKEGLESNLTIGDGQNLHVRYLDLI